MEGFFSGVDYAPRVFDSIRENFGINSGLFAADMGRLGKGKEGEGKSKQLFFQVRASVCLVRTKRPCLYRWMCPHLHNVLERIICEELIDVGWSRLPDPNPADAQTNKIRPKTGSTSSKLSKTSSSITSLGSWETTTIT